VDSTPTVEPRPPPAMQDALQFKLVFVRTPMHFEKALCRNGILRGRCIPRRSIRRSLKQFKFRTIEY
jgi:hypothetical protein